MTTHLRFWGLWLFFLLLIPGAMWAAGWRPNEIPGTSAGWPGWEPGRLLDDGYYHEADLWLAEQSPAQDVGLLARYELDYRLLGDSPADNVAVGSDGWLFVRSFVDVSCESLGRVAAPDVPADRDDQFTYVVALSKAYWLSDLLEPHDRPAACTRAEREAIRTTLRSDPRGLDINTAIDAHPATSFHERDPHWSPLGRVRVAETLVESLAPGLWNRDAVGPSTETFTPGALRFAGSNDNETIPGFSVDRGAEFTIEEQSFGLGLLIWQRSSTSGADVIPGTTYMFGDSQGASLVPLIEQYFEELVFVGWLRAALGPLPHDQLPEPDRMIVESVDQGAHDTFRNPAIAELAQRLPLDG